MFNDFLTIIVIFAVWFTLMRYVLPAFGITTCMSGSCCRNPNKSEKDSIPYE